MEPYRTSQNLTKINNHNETTSNYLSNADDSYLTSGISL